jgi:hypothetical protein
MCFIRLFIHSLRTLMLLLILAVPLMTESSLYDIIHLSTTHLLRLMWCFTARESIDLDGKVGR